MFDHTLWHDGEPVTDGTKHVMRTDVLYERASTPTRTKEQRVLRDHEGYVFVVTPLGDGSLASGSRDRTIRIWTRAADDTWSCARVLRGHAASVLSLLELEGGGLVSGSRDRTVRTWDRDDEGGSTVIATLGGAVLSLARLDDGTIACGAADGRITIVTRSGATVRELAGHTGWVWSLASIGRDRLVSASDDGRIRLWIPSRGECIAAAAPGRGPAHALAVLDDGSVAAAFADGHVVVYDASQGLAPIAVHRAAEGELYALHALAGGGFASGGEATSARIHRGPPTALDAAEVVRCGGFIRSICEVPGTNRLAVAGYDGCIRLS